MAIEKLSDTTTKQRDVRVKVPWSDVKRMLGEAAMSHVGLRSDRDRDAAAVAVKLEEQKRDSGAYGTGEWYAFVTVTVQLD